MTSVGQAPCPALAPVTSPRFLLSPSRPSGAPRLLGVHTREPGSLTSTAPSPHSWGVAFHAAPGGAAVGASGGHRDGSLTRFQAENAEGSMGGDRAGASSGETARRGGASWSREDESPHCGLAVGRLCAPFSASRGKQ